MSFKGCAILQDSIKPFLKVKVKNKSQKILDQNFWLLLKSCKSSSRVKSVSGKIKKFHFMKN